MSFLRRVILVLALGLAAMVYYHSVYRLRVQARLHPRPAEFVRVSLDDLLSRPQEYNGRVVETEGYIRFLSFFPAAGGTDANDLEPSQRTYYALSTSPVLYKDPADRTFRKTGVTNLYVVTHTLLPNGPATEGLLRKTTVLGHFTLKGEEKELRLMAFSPADVAKSPEGPRRTN